MDEEDEISIWEASKIICNAFKFKGNLVKDTTKMDGQLKKTASNKEMRDFWPDFEFTPFEDAIRETVDWFIKNYDTLARI